MPKIVWDQGGEHLYEVGVDHGVLYPTSKGVYQTGVPWNGLTTVTESPSGAESNPQYADNIKYLDLYSAEEFGATIEAFTYPEEFELCDGSAEIVPGVTIGQQARNRFGFSWRGLVGNDTEGNEHGYKLHIVWGAMASPSEKANATVNDSPEPATFSWETTTTPVAVTNHKPTSHMVINSTRVSPEALKAVEEKLYGTESGEPELPTPDEIITLLGSSGGA